MYVSFWNHRWYCSTQLCQPPQRQHKYMILKHSVFHFLSCSQIQLIIPADQFRNNSESNIENSKDCWCREIKILCKIAELWIDSYISLTVNFLNRKDVCLEVCMGKNSCSVCDYIPLKANLIVHWKQRQKMATGTGSCQQFRQNSLC